ncbi:MAG: TRAP transporter small permease [Firmicutes bacterium]|nr:TRAP transporter small permease [Bacillota bacterium]
MGKRRPLVIRALDLTAWASENVSAVFLGIMTVVITWQVFSRKVLSAAPYWSEELAIILMVWFGLLGSAVGVRKGTHIALEFFMSLFPPRVRQVNQIVLDLLVLAFSVFLMVEGVELVRVSRTITMPALKISQSLVYMVIPVIGVLICLYTLESLARDILALRKEAK